MTNIIAHRGYSENFPENTMLAFKKSLENNADGIELDLHLTKDKKVVICHDGSINRTSNGKGRINDKTLSELKKYKFNRKMKKIDYNVEIPTLVEFMEWFSNFDKFVNIEIKAYKYDYMDLVLRTLDIIDNYNMKDRTIISSFNQKALKFIKKIDPFINVGFLTRKNIKNPGEYCRKNNIDYFHPKYKILDKDSIDNCRRNGIEINAWTVNDIFDIDKLVLEGIHGIITNSVETAVLLNKKTYRKDCKLSLNAS
ncbi:MAG: glycerophosphodiester phosphodiesterase family protein [Tissierellia bacterium]|nr:glycerophosphodiester phosphodiesterase family protein [Tissierellia bacterium]